MIYTAKVDELYSGYLSGTVIYISAVPGHYLDEVSLISTFPS